MGGKGSVLRSGYLGGGEGRRTCILIEGKREWDGQMRKRKSVERQRSGGRKTYGGQKKVIG